MDKKSTVSSSTIPASSQTSLSTKSPNLSPISKIQSTLQSPEVVQIRNQDISNDKLKQNFFYVDSLLRRKLDLESAIIRSNVPLDLSETEEILLNGQKSLWVNKEESDKWKGEYPISKYPINDDPNPEVIRKQTGQQLVYHQEVAIRYLRPPTPTKPGDIIIRQEKNSFPPSAPPLVIRQQPIRLITPPPLVIREAPPPPPPTVGRKVITISGKKMPPPPRKVIIERLPQIPCKPQSIIIERWLPYKQIKRRVIYTKVNDENDEIVPVKQKNIIVQWDPPKVEIKKQFKDLGEK